MSFSFPLDNMTLAEKISLMEHLWDELCADPEAIPSPTWHAAVLADRESMLRDGADTPADWEEAKQRIRESLI